MTDEAAQPGLVLSHSQLDAGRFVLEPLITSTAEPWSRTYLSKTEVFVATLEGRSRDEIRAGCLVAAQLHASLRGEKGPGRRDLSWARRRPKGGWSRCANPAAGLLAELTQRKLDWSGPDAMAMTRLALGERHADWWDFRELAWAATRVLGAAGPGPEVDALFSELYEIVDGLETDHDNDQAELLARMRPLLPVVSPDSVDVRVVAASDPWGRAVRGLLIGLTDPTGVTALLVHLGKARVEPTSEWSEQCAELLAASPLGPGLVAAMVAFVPLHGMKSAGRELRPYSAPNVPLVLGAVHALALTDVADAVELLAAGAAFTGMRTPASGFAPDPWTAKACIGSLARIGTDEAVAALGRLEPRIRHNLVRAAIKRAFRDAAARAGLSVDQVIERTVPTFGLEAEGRRSVQLDGTEAVLAVDDRRVGLRFKRQGGKLTRSVPAAVRSAQPEVLAQLRREAKEATKVLAAERRRLEALLVEGPEWPYRQWRPFYFHHPLTGHWVSRLIWEHRRGRGRWRASMLEEGTWTDADGATQPQPVATSKVRLWHPVRASPEEVAAWRDRLSAREHLRQPFKQAWREVYRPTLAEAETRTYSNRFAGHRLSYPQAFALMKRQGWDPAVLDYRFNREGSGAKGFRSHAAIFDYELVGSGEDWGWTPTLCSSDRVYFPVSRGPRGSEEQVRIEDVPPIVFSEAMRDVDLFVSVAAVGTDTPWGDGDDQGPGENVTPDHLTGTTATRRAALERLLPRTAIADRCRIEGRYLIVEGSRDTYRIHLGSGGVSTGTGYAFLCIVPGRHEPDRIFLPFEEDGGRLSEILSKAFLLVDDACINDPTILEQLPPLRPENE